MEEVGVVGCEAGKGVEGENMGAVLADDGVVAEAGWGATAGGEHYGEAGRRFGGEMEGKGGLGGGCGNSGGLN